MFGFGLFHGFGFAAAMEEIGVLREHIGLTLFGFNLGVELGQLAIVVVVFPLLFLVRRLAIYRERGAAAGGGGDDPDLDGVGGGAVVRRPAAEARDGRLGGAHVALVTGVAEKGGGSACPGC